MEIKFKVLNTETNEIEKNDKWYYLDCEGCVISFFREVGFSKALNLKPLFSTNLNDTNGIEIYEGDIIGGLVVTFSSDQQAGLGMDCGWYLQADDFERFEPLESRCNENGNNYTIQGNIYENPELLK
jgi:hypothetical protein